MGNVTKFVGTPGRTRTCGLLLRRQALYPLSYGRVVPYEYSPRTSARPPSELQLSIRQTQCPYVHCAG